MENYDGLFHKEDYADMIAKDNHDIRELSYSRIEDGIILPYKHIDDMVQGGGIVDSNGKMIAESQITHGAYNSYPVIDKNRKSRCIYMGCYSPIWGHFITDSIKFVWFLSSKYYSQYNDYEIVYISEFGRVSGNFRRLLELLGCKVDDWKIVSDVTVYEEIILPDESWYIDSEGTPKFTDEYVKCIDKVRDSISARKSKKYEKVYFAYPYINVGEKSIQRYLRSKGYKIIIPEKHNLDELLSILSGCKEFASTDGSCGHNVAFLQDHARVLLISRFAALNDYQQAINRIHSQDIYYIDSTLSIGTQRKRARKGVYFYYISDNLRDYFNDGKRCNVNSLIKIKYLLYLNLVVLSGGVFDGEALSYYGNELNRLLVRYDTMRPLVLIKRRILKAFLKLVGW